MATTFKLTWRDGTKKGQGGCWRKRYHGKDYYFSRMSGETKESSYSRCWREWLVKKAEIDRDEIEKANAVVRSDQTSYQAEIEGALSRMKAIEASGSTDFMDGINWQNDRILVDELQGLALNKVPSGSILHTDDEGRQVYQGKPVTNGPPPPWKSHRSITNASGMSPDLTISGNLERFLRDKQEQVEKGNRSAGRFEWLRTSLNDFAKRFDEFEPITSLNSQALIDYRDFLKKKVADGDLSSYSARDALANVKQFARWAFEEELIDLPRKLNSKDLSIDIEPNEIETFTDHELRYMLGEPTPASTKLYLLLMLNTGCQQTDIAKLKQSEVNWVEGRITRKRSKTKKHKKVPVVNYKLWPETFELLAQHRSKDSELALLNTNNSPLVTTEIVNGKLKKIDNIRSAYCRMIKRLKTPYRDRAVITISKPLKCIRKTSATHLRRKHPEFVDLFLGHAASSMADQHYARYDQGQFDEAVKWLRTALPIQPDPKP